MYLLVLPLAVLLLAGTPVAAQDDLHTNYESLKQAVEQKDAALVQKLGAETCALARKAAAATAPADAAEKNAWTKAVAFAKEVQVYSEYALYATALQSPADTRLELLAALEAQNPKSKYLDAAYAHYFLALNETGGSAKIPAHAEKALANFPQNEDLLMVVMDHALVQKQSARAGAYAERLVAAVKGHAKPEEAPAADWEKKRTLALMRGYWIAGMAHAEKNNHFATNQNLRAALPLIQGNKPMLAAALFHLGVANYWLGKQSLNRPQILEAAKFSEQASAIAGPFQQQAWTNAHLMKAEADKMFARK